MTDFGLLPQGFVPARVADLLSQVQADQRALLGPNTVTSAEGVLGALNSVIIPRIADVWELGEIVYKARDPQGATAQAADQISAITGTLRRGATAGLVSLSVTLNAGVTLPAGSMASVAGQPANRWATTVAVTNPGGSPATLPVPAQCTQTGPIVANAGQISVIATPVSGWTAVTNPLDASEGKLAETDAQLLLRRLEELSNPGESTLPAMYAHLSEVTAMIAGIANVPVVASVTVQENASDFVDALGRAPKTVEAIVQFTPGLSGADLTAARAAFALQLWQSKPGGIDSVGSMSLSVLDVQGNSHTVHWTEATLVPIWVSVFLQIDPTAYDASNAAVKAAIADPTTGFGSTLRLGQRVIRNLLLDAIMETPGVLDLANLEIGLNAVALHEENININGRSLASFDTSRITITTTTADL